MLKGDGVIGEGRDGVIRVLLTCNILGILRTIIPDTNCQFGHVFVSCV